MNVNNDIFALLTPLYPEETEEETVLDDFDSPQWLDEVRYPLEDMPDWTIKTPEVEE